MSETAAARVRRLSPLPLATAPRVLDEQGMTIMPSCRKEPEAGEAPTSLAGWTWMLWSRGLASSGMPARVEMLMPSMPNSS